MPLDSHKQKVLKMGKLEEKALDIIEKLENLVTDNADKAVDLALETVRLESVLTLSLGGMFFLLSIIAASLATWMWLKFERWSNGQEFLGALAIVTSGVLFLAGVVHVAKVETWMGLFAPETVLALRIIG